MDDSTKGGTYSQGYAAGRRRAKRDDAKAYIAAKREDYRNQVMLAVLPIIASGTWDFGGVRVRTTQDYARLAADFGDRVSAQAVFLDDRAPIND